MTHSPNYRAQVSVILIGFVFLAVCYGVWIPAGEGVDEVAHFEYIRFLKEQRKLPVQPTQPGEALSVLMGHHPPLYYALNALLLTGQDTSQSDQVFRPNPHFVWAEDNDDNVWNVMIHTGQDKFPGQGVIRAFFTVRLFGVVYGVITLFAIFQAVRCAFPKIAWLPFLATVVIAFNPSFIYMSSTIHHDILLAMWFALGAWWMMHYIQTRSFNDPLLAGVLVGCATMTKVTGVVLGLGVATVILLRAIREQDWLTSLRDGIVGAGAAALIGGPWFARNRLLYGDFLGWNAYRYVFRANLRPEPSLYLGIRDFLQQSSRNFWGGFGFMHIVFPEIARVFWIATLIVMLGWVALLLRDRRFFKQYSAVLLAGSILLLGILGVYLGFSTMNLGAGHGRYLFPAAFSIGVLLSIGILGLVGQRRLKWAAIAIGIGLFGYALWLPVAHVLPKYTSPTTVDSLPTGVQAVNQQLSSGVRLIGYELSTDQPLVPGMGLETVLYWQVDRSANVVSDPVLVLTLEIPNGQILSRNSGWPTPSLPPSSWPQDKIVATRRRLYVPELELPGMIQLKAEAEQNDESDAILISELLTVGGATQIQPEQLPADLNVLFGDEFLLRGYQLSAETFKPGEIVTVTLFWQVVTTPTSDLTVFVHVLGASGQLVAQLDRPAGGSPSPTSTWREGQAWRDSYPIRLPASLPSGAYTLQLGMYDWPSLDRLPIADTDQTTWQLGEIQIITDRRGSGPLQTAPPL